MKFKEGERIIPLTSSSTKYTDGGVIRKCISTVCGNIYYVMWDVDIPRGVIAYQSEYFLVDHYKSDIKIKRDEILKDLLGLLITT